MIEFLTGYTSGVTWFDWVIDICTGVVASTFVASVIWLVMTLTGRLDDGYASIGVPVKATGRIKVYDKDNTVNRSTTSHST
jgi:hypothetical protein